MSDTNIYPINHPYVEENLYDPADRNFAVPAGLTVYVEDMSMQKLRSFNANYYYKEHLWALRQMRTATGTYLPIAANIQWPELFFWLPGVSDEELAALSQVVPDVMCKSAADLLAIRPVLVWKTTVGTELEVHEWVHGLNKVDIPRIRGFSVTFMNERTIKYTSYHFSPEAASEFCAYLQVHESMADNYCPKKVWGEKEVEASKWLVFAPRPDLIVPQYVPLEHFAKTLWELNKLKQNDDI